MGVTTWPDHHIAFVRRGLLDGLSAGQIAAAFYEQLGLGVSRNAVIGIVKRNTTLAAIGFARESTNARKGQGKRPPKPGRGKPLPVARVPSAPRLVPAAVAAAPPRPVLPQRRSIEDMIACRNAPVAPGADAAGLALADLDRLGCRFPVREDGRTTFFCAVVVSDHVPLTPCYCAFHRAWLRGEGDMAVDLRRAA